MKRLFPLLLALLLGTMGLAAENRLTSSVASMDGLEGYSYNKEISGRLAMEVYSPADASGAIAFGSQPAADNVTPSAMATVLANALMKDGTHSTMTANDGTPVHMVTSKDGSIVLAIAGDRNAPSFVVLIFQGEAAAKAPALLKSLKIKK